MIKLAKAGLCDQKYMTISRERYKMLLEKLSVLRIWGKYDWKDTEVVYDTIDTVKDVTHKKWLKHVRGFYG